MSSVLRKPKDDVIYFWGGKDGKHPAYRWLGNFYPSPFELNGKEYKTVEHFYQASKATNEFDHERIRTAEYARTAKNLGNKVFLRKDWEQIKNDVMRIALLEKFSQNSVLCELLLETGNKVLHEDSPYDKIWGWFKGKGEDRLGKLLMGVRDTIRRENLKKKVKKGQQVGQ